MQWTSIVAIYALFWVVSAFVLLPFGVRTHDEMGIEKTPGQADSAPGNFPPRTGGNPGNGTGRAANRALCPQLHLWLGDGGRHQYLPAAPAIELFRKERRSSQSRSRSMA